MLALGNVPPLVIGLAAAALGYALPAIWLRVTARRWRKAPHSRTVRIVSGAGVFAAFVVPLVVLASGEAIRPVALACAAVFVVGVADDVHTLPRWLKLLLFAAVAYWAHSLGIRIDTVKPPFTTAYANLGLWSAPVTVIWLLGVMWAIALSRRVPGLTPGLVALISLTFAAAAGIAPGSPRAVTVAITFPLAGAALGYLRYELPPARMMLGSSGHYALGFALAAVSVIGALKNTAFLVVGLPLLVLAVPLLNTTYAAVYASRRGRAAFTIAPRAEYLHQIMLREGVRLRHVVLLFYMMTAYLCLVGLILVVVIEVSFLVKFALLAVLVAIGLVGFYVTARVLSHPDAVGHSAVELLGVAVHRTDVAGALHRITQFVEEGAPHHVVTPDSSALVRAQEDPELMDILRSADLVTADGAGVVWMAKVLGLPLWERVSGVDLMDHICELAAEKRYSVYLLGAAPGVAKAAAQKLQECYPGLTVAGTTHGYFNETQESQVVHRIAEAKPDILFVALGVPKQEKWIRRHLDDLKAPVAIGVGGSFDVISGRVRRAPAFMRRWGLEWLWRTLWQPSRLPRLAALPRFVWMAAADRIRRRGQAGRPGQSAPPG
ncbi:MAG: WecB/TagA/CpsF family glycosyltransferase [Armatimonadota bacterium]|nr:MAG: WecB/TagA/CpsF family glycosyltransferase [Armatimonadota bacterium]